jgi:phosphoadenosine phosphosulfate reductase
MVSFVTDMQVAIDPDSSSQSCSRLDAYFGDREGRALLEPLITRVFPGRIALVSSFGAESAVLLHMVASIDRATPVIFLNTGKLFGETLAYRETIVERLGLTDVRDIRPDPVDAARADPAGDLWNRDVSACCWFRKVLPLQRALSGFSAWITGRKRFQSSGRASLGTFETEFERIKVNPLTRWSPERIAAYIAEHDLPAHPLVAQGYASIGCAPCTSPVTGREDSRDGRWRGQDKTECGIHFVQERVIRSSDRHGEGGDTA